MKTVVIYCTHVLNKELFYFINHGYIQSEAIDYYICFNGDFRTDQYNERAKELQLTNLQFHGRPNEGHDFGGWSEVLNLIGRDGKRVCESYDYYIFMNSTCIGPFLPLYVKQNWTEVLTGMIDERIKLVGPTINHFYGKPHVQSYCMCTDRIGLMIGLAKGIFDNGVKQTKLQIVENKEVAFSLAIIEVGYAIKSLLKAYDKINFSDVVGVTKITLPFGTIGTSMHHCDPCKQDGYHGISFHPYEVVFFKSNRGITPTILSSYMKFHNSDSHYNTNKHLVKRIFE